MTMPRATRSHRPSSTSVLQSTGGRGQLRAEARPAVAQGGEEVGRGTGGRLEQARSARTAASIQARSVRVTMASGVAGDGVDDPRRPVVGGPGVTSGTSDPSRPRPRIGSPGP